MSCSGKLCRAGSRGPVLKPFSGNGLGTDDRPLAQKVSLLRFDSVFSFVLE